MLDIGKMISSNLKLKFTKINQDNKEQIEDDMDSFNEHNQDPIHTWLKLAKAKSGTTSNDNILLELIVHLHKKIDKLENIIRGDADNNFPLDLEANITHINHDYIELDNFDIITDKLYGRIDMPIFPSREIPILFSHYEKSIYKIDYINDKDSRDFDAYIVAKERADIRKKKVQCE